MITTISQIALVTLIGLSFLLIIAVPVSFASPNGWSENKNYIVIGTTSWIILVFLIGALNYFII